VSSAADALAAAVERLLPGWVVGCVARFTDDAAVLGRARAAGEDAAPGVAARLRAVETTPLSVMRDAVAVPAAVLRSAGAQPVERDAFSVERFPDDVYDLTPASWADVDPALVDLALMWGVETAWKHKRDHS
jgi:hypothetical protein